MTGRTLVWLLGGSVVAFGIGVYALLPSHVPSDYCRPAWHPTLYCTPGTWTP